MSQNELKDNQMNRGLNQALYKYLPHSWIDFYKKVDRTAYTAYVKNWNSGILSDKALNKHRVLLRVGSVLNEFKEKGDVKDFLFPINESTYEIRTPDPGLNADVITEISPLTFFCSKCYKVHSYRTSDQFTRLNPRKVCIDCKSTIKQLNLVYACKCGWGGPVEPIPCPNHGDKNLYYRGDFSYYCKHEKNRKIEIQRVCPSCNKGLRTKNALDMSNYYPFSITMIDLVDIELDQFLQEDDDAAEILLSYWLGRLNRDELKKLVKSKSVAISNEEYNEKLQQLEAQHPGIPLEVLKQIANTFLDASPAGISSDHLVTEIKQSIFNLSNKYLEDLAVQILEYDTVLNPKRQNVSTLDDAINISKKLNTNANPERFHTLAQDFGIRHVQASGDIPFILCSYGYTRKETDPQKGAVLMGFPAESRNKKNVYAAKLDTEGILFEFDRAKIIKWLLKNEVITEIDAPDLENEAELKIWFLNHVHTNAISTFSPIDEKMEKITFHVYNLIHSMSHALLKQAANLCGLDKNSLSEYIFPNIPAVLIYCQNSQGTNIGALFNLFEAYFDKWLESTKDDLEKCIFDPVCIDRDRSCPGCLQVNEVSCVHFNKDLDRRMLIGWVDKTSGKRTHGFWEEC